MKKEIDYKGIALYEMCKASYKQSEKYKEELEEYLTIKYKSEKIADNGLIWDSVICGDESGIKFLNDIEKEYKK